MKKCLIVDDSKIVRRMARRIVEELGLSIAEAEDGQIALTQCKETMPDIILLDWYMPNMTGIEFVKALRKVKGGKKPAVVFCTIENNAESIQEALEAGADEYIMKPFDIDIIRTKFEQVNLL